MSPEPTQRRNIDQIDEERIFLPDSPANHIPHGVAYVHALPIVRNQNVVDLCCGTGYGTRLMAEAANRVTGYDYSETAINYANRFDQPKLRFFTADVEQLDKIEASVITCMQGLEHLNDPKGLIQKNLDKTWVFALPNDTDLNNEHHHHKITMAVIQDWFKGNAMVDYFDDYGNFSKTEPEWFTNFFGVYKP